MERKLTLVLLFLLTVSVVGLVSQAGVQRFASLHIGASFQDPGAGAISLDAGITANSVGIIGSDGRIPALSSTFLANLSGANLTGLNVPDVTGTETVSGIWTFSAAPDMSAVAGSAPDVSSIFIDSVVKAWARVSFSGGVPSIDDDFNVSAVADLGVGVTRVDWDTDMPDATYAVVATSGELHTFISGALLTTAAVVATSDSTDTLVDADFSVVVIGE